MYRDVLGAGDEVEINAGTWRATLNGTTDVSNNLDWSGQPEFFELLPGRNDLKIEYTGGSVQVQVTAKGRYW